MATTRNANANKVDERDNDAPRDQFEGIEPDEYGRVPGDVRTEPVATAAQAARPGNDRVGPPSVAQDASADWYCPPGVTQIEPGEEVSADTVIVDAPLELDDVVDESGHDVSEHKDSGARLAARGDADAVNEPSKPTQDVAKPSGSSSSK